jgi:hypothetical protein
MVSWHLLTHPSYPRVLAFAVIQPFNFVAEGFVLLAGVALGLKIARSRWTTPALLRRAGSILASHYVLVLFVVALAAAEQRVGLQPQVPALPTDAWAILSLQYQPYLADVLSVFVLLFLASPLFGLIYTRFGGPALLGVSVGIFATARMFPINANGAFDFNTWQLVFAAGMLLGAHLDAVLARWTVASAATIAAWILVFVAAAAVRLFIAGPDGVELPGWRGYLTFSRKPLSIARLVYIGSEMMVIALITAKCWAYVSDWRVISRIAMLGRYSLQVFFSSVVLDYLFKAACTYLGISFPANLLVWMIELAALFALAGLLDGRTAARPRRPVVVSSLAVS